MITTAVDISIRSFPIHNDGATPPVYDTLIDAQLVKVNSDGSISSATAGIAVGAYGGKLQQTNTGAVRLRNLTARVIQNGAITCGADVIQDSSAPTKVITYAVGGKIMGTKISPPTAGSAGDIIEIVLASGSGVGAGNALAVPVAGVLHGNVNSAFSSLNSTAVNPTKTDFDALLAACETLADDVRSLQAANVTAGIVTLA